MTNYLFGIATAVAVQLAWHYRDALRAAAGRLRDKIKERK